MWVSRVIASQHKKERVYVTLNGYRWDDFKTYAYMSDNYGQSWKSISSNIPMSPVNVIKEDPENENILYLGTDNGAYVSFDNGTNWEAFSNGLPNVAFHDIVVQPEAKHLLLGTHGRSIYKADISAMQKMNTSMKNKAITLFDVESVRASRQWGNSWSKWMDVYEPTKSIGFYAANSGQQKLQVLTENGSVLNTVSIDTNKGFNFADYDLTITESGKNALMKEDTKLNISEAKNGKYYLPKGKYTIQIGNEKTSFEVK